MIVSFLLEVIKLYNKHVSLFPLAHLQLAWLSSKAKLFSGILLVDCCRSNRYHLSSTVTTKQHPQHWSSCLGKLPIRMKYCETLSSRRTDGRRRLGWLFPWGMFSLSSHPGDDDDDDRAAKSIPVR